jgi:Tfp pilus assembly protein PilE
MNKAITAIIVVVVGAVLIATAYVSYSGTLQPKQSASLANASVISSLNGTANVTANGTATSASLPNSTLNGSVSTDQNYSVLSSGNIPSSP